ncbi:aldo/keto reductase [Lentibacillus amyloliquefaciens]|uniref:Oxidoreductase n=1 Tax=Lentibacillus amyloliquefaciens TaxID=1472767 RepID=A0A0U4FH98_9BACI|nr:aldo/keto reductase [Lentibacillus amyloliquefaciens]ALX48014.1 oxidoreductase [Lentibacillus amyloliquefaciens]
MKKNRLGQSDLHVSELTLGCMSLGTDSKKASEMIDRALDAGINHLDTADLYDFGENEEIVGSAIKNKRDQIILTTKVGNNFDKANRDWFWDPSKEHIEQGVKDSLRRLGTDYIDFYMLHGGTIDDPIGETIEAFENLKKEGLIRAYGISSIRPNVIREYVQRSNMDAVMMQYNMLDRRPEEDILGLLDENRISVLARGPLAKGMLSDRASDQIEKKGKDGFLDYSHDELRTIQQELKKINHENSMNTLALNYILTHPAVASAVFGASSFGQIDDNTRYDLSPLSDDTYRKIRKITKALQYTSHR